LQRRKAPCSKPGDALQPDADLGKQLKKIDKTAAEAGVADALHWIAKLLGPSFSG
jgi:hypothetical protein